MTFLSGSIIVTFEDFLVRVLLTSLMKLASLSDLRDELEAESTDELTEALLDLLRFALMALALFILVLAPIFLGGVAEGGS